MNELKIFQNSDFGELGVMMIDGKEYFPATQCAKILGYADPFKAVKQHCEEDGWVKRPVIDNLGRTQEMKFINEGNLYRLITRSKLPAAKKFERWVFDEVLPEIRRTGSYGSVNMNLETVIVKAVSAAVSEAVKAMIPFIMASEAQPAPDPAKCIRRKYKHTTPSKISTLDPELKKQVDDMIVSGEYSCQKIANFIMNNSDIEISQMAVNRYKHNYFYFDDDMQLSLF
jgi:ORF016